MKMLEIEASRGRVDSSWEGENQGDRVPGTGYSVLFYTGS